MSIDLGKPINPDSKDGIKLLRDLQGNILKGHGRDHAMHLFVSFGKSSDERSVSGARDWIGSMASDHVTSAAAQKDEDRKLSVLTILLLSSPGYKFLDERKPRDQAFREGMVKRGSRLNDPPFEKWSPNYQVKEEDVHALVIVAAPQILAPEAVAELNRVKTRIEGDVKDFGGSILIDQRGRQERDSAGRAVEHFGYADGVSQPQFFVDGSRRVEKKKFDQVTDLKIVLEKDRHGDGGYGSFFVYRLLEQNVQSFDTAVEEVARQLGLSAELVGAMAVGRFKNGTPLTTHGKPKKNYDPNQDEDFNYDDDEDGRRCPRHAHIRKVNPRGELGFFTDLIAREKKRRIARRGITYSEAGTVGLIFMCFQGDIEDQFEFMQNTWANNRNFSKPGTGLDPVIGQDGGPQEANDAPSWPTAYDSDEKKRIPFNEHVTLLGGGYFFAPSISGLRELAASD